jgi:hypothetical protein
LPVVGCWTAALVLPPFANVPFPVPLGSRYYTIVDLVGAMAPELKSFCSKNSIQSRIRDILANTMIFKTWFYQVLFFYLTGFVLKILPKGRSTLVTRGHWCKVRAPNFNWD